MFIKSKWWGRAFGLVVVIIALCYLPEPDPAYALPPGNDDIRFSIFGVLMIALGGVTIAMIINGLQGFGRTNVFGELDLASIPGFAAGLFCSIALIAGGLLIPWNSLEAWAFSPIDYGAVPFFSHAFGPIMIGLGAPVIIVVAGFGLFRALDALR